MWVSTALADEKRKIVKAVLFLTWKSVSIKATSKCPASWHFNSRTTCDVLWTAHHHVGLYIAALHRCQMSTYRMFIMPRDVTLVSRPLFWSRSRSRSRSFWSRSRNRFLVSVSVSISVSHSLVSVSVLVSICSGLINKPDYACIYQEKWWGSSVIWVLCWRLSV